MTAAPHLSSLQSVPGVTIPYSEHSTQDYMPASMQPDVPQTSESSKVANALKARKRTKTGCLTCRKRRIKCGEERPTCKNCTKSKRDCEGYIPRVVFKESSGRAPIPVHGAYYTQHGYHIPDAANLFGPNPMLPMEGASYPAIAPRPTMEGMQHPPDPISRCNTHWGAQDAYATMPGPSGYVPPTYGYMPTSAPSDPTYAAPQRVNSYGTHEPLLNPLNYHHMSPSNQYHNQTIPTSNGLDTANYPPTSNGWSYSPESLLSQSNLTSPISTPYNFDPHGTNNGRPPQHQREQQQQQQPPIPDFAFKPDMDIQPAWANTQIGNRYLRPLDHYAQDFVNAQVKDQNQIYGLPGDISLQREPEDDWFDVDSDEEGAVSKPDTSRSDLGLIIARHAHLKNGDIRSMNNLLNEPNVLAAYNPSYAASPLKDAQTARVFCHFITSTGPTLHVCERHPSNPAVVFTGHPVPKSQQAMWSYTLPMLALHDQGLMHAMLALASLHIAKLQQTSPTPSLRHYHYALRRVAKALSHPKKRNEPATLAATLLLGYYEVTTAEHNKWNSHLSGARELVMEIPFDRLSKRIEAFRRKKEQEENLRRSRSNHSNSYHFSHRASHDIMTLNDRRLDRILISNLMGWDVRNDETGEIVVDEGAIPQPERPLSQKDLDEYEVQLDLFWWYAKQDVFQSIISGNGLLLTYERWARIPPRAPVGRLDAVYGSMDHLFLLMARLANFAGKDLPRKKRAFNEAQKAAKRSTPPSSTNASPPRQAPMYGMMPDPGPVTVPRGFDQASHDRIFTGPVPSDSKPLDIAFAEAQVEWSAIATAFDTFYASLGPSYEPLSPEHMTPLSTPFGPAVYYRSYSVACVLCLFHCGRIILNRVAPSMPPAAMVASAVAAQSTAIDANTIGRICAGIQPVSNTAPLNPHHGAALMDVCMGLFHAGIQYRDPAQRGWTITKLRDVARLTGWQTSALIASGCERAWIHFAELGKGPPYERTMNKTAKDDRIAGRSRDPEKLMEVPKDNNDRRFVKVNAGTRVYWAMGILSVDEDMRELSLGDEA